MPIFKKGKMEDVGNCRQANLSFMSRKVMEQITLETYSKHMKDKKVTGRISMELWRWNDACRITDLDKWAIKLGEWLVLKLWSAAWSQAGGQSEMVYPKGTLVLRQILFNLDN